MIGSEARTLAIRIPKKRKAGTRAGMTRAKIIEAATKLWLSRGPDEFSVRTLATTLKVGPTTIHAHIKGGVGELRREIARAILGQLAPPYKPAQEPEDYLRALFRSALATFRQKPVAGHLVVLAMAHDPLLSPVFAERLLATIAAISGDQDLSRHLHLVIEQLGRLILFETGDWAMAPPEANQRSVLATIGALPEAEFPTLKQSVDKLAAEPLKRAHANYFNNVADNAVDAVLAELGKPRGSRVSGRR
jgi:AcrR family transcriptional regulator